MDVNSVEEAVTSNEKKTFLIAEISNQHEGSIFKAKELIRMAKEAGANAVKSVAYRVADMMKYGSMPQEFYEKCQLSLRQYEELIDFAETELKIPLFYTILSSKYEPLRAKQKYVKLSAAMTENENILALKKYNRDNVFMSFSEPPYGIEQREVSNVNIMYATGYTERIKRKTFNAIKQMVGKKIGVSHNSKGFQDIVNLSKETFLPCVEKHFKLDDVYHKGQIYRDSLHALLPKDFERLAKALKP